MDDTGPHAGPQSGKYPDVREKWRHGYRGPDAESEADRPGGREVQISVTFHSWKTKVYGEQEKERNERQTFTIVLHDEWAHSGVWQTQYHVLSAFRERAKRRPERALPKDRVQKPQGVCRVQPAAPPPTTPTAPRQDGAVYPPASPQQAPRQGQPHGGQRARQAGD